ncbi:MAG: hypothetical protein V4455_14865 [Pseudomonadota bacterium]
MKMLLDVLKKLLMTELVFLRRLQVNVNPKYPYVRQSLISLSVFGACWRRQRHMCPALKLGRYGAGQ